MKIFLHRFATTALLGSLLVIVSSSHAWAQQSYFEKFKESLGIDEQTESDTGDESLPAPQNTDSGATVDNIPSPTVEEVPREADSPSTNPTVSPFENAGPVVGAPVDVPAEESTAAAQADRPYLGLTAEDLTGGGIGLRVVELQDNSPAWKAGLAVGDQILAINGRGIASLDHFASEILQHQPRDVVEFLVDRRGRTMSKKVVLGSAYLAARINGSVPANDPAATLPDNTQELPPQTPSRARIGLNVTPLTLADRNRLRIPVAHGALVTMVAPGTPAARAGLQPGDCIVQIDDKVIQSNQALAETIHNLEPGRIVSLSYFRNGTLETVSIRLDAASDDIAGQYSLRPMTPTPAPNILSIPTQAEIEALEAEINSLQIQLEEKRRLLEATR